MKTWRIVSAVAVMLFLFSGMPAAAQQWSWEQVDAECDITSMWGSSSDDMYVGGGKGMSGCLYHYDGTAWEPVVISPFTPIVFGIWGSSAEDVYVVGIGGLYHFDGFSWTGIDNSHVWQGVWGSAPEDVFISGSEIRHYDGADWTTMTIPASGASPSIRSVWGTGSTDVYAVGTNSTVLHYNGNSIQEWSALDAGLSGTSYDLYDIWGSADDDLFAVGAGSTILHYNGSSWTEMDSHLSYWDWIHSIWGSSSSDVYACTFENGDVLHYDGEEWSIVDTGLSIPSSTILSFGPISAAGVSGDVNLKAVWGIGADVYFAGDDGMILHYQTDPTLIELASFIAEPSDRAVVLEWVTESEIDTAGFHVYRAERREGAYTRITPELIPSRGGPAAGASYEFVDSGMRNRRTLYYKLEDTDINGTATMHGPVSATLRRRYGAGL